MVFSRDRNLGSFMSKNIGQVTKAQGMTVWMIMTLMFGPSSVILIIALCVCMAWRRASQQEPQDEFVSSDDVVMPAYVYVVESEA